MPTRSRGRAGIHAAYGIGAVVCLAAMQLFCPLLLARDEATGPWAARQVYLENCVGCHGPDRTGFIGVSLTPPDLGPLSEAALRALIRSGVLETLMPSWDCRLTLQELRLLSRYLKSTPPEIAREIVIGPDGSLTVLSGKTNWWDDPGRIERGRSLFMEHCLGCHHPEVEAFAPAYRTVSRQRDMGAIVGQIKFPYSSSKILGYRDQTMPKFDLPDSEIRDLGAYVFSHRNTGK